STAAQGIASAMATHISYNSARPKERKLIIDIASFCGVQPELEHDPAIWLPSGWRFLPSSDGVGTLAPAELFSPAPMTVVDPGGPPTAFIERADQAVQNGYYATALHYLRQGRWYCGVEHPIDLARRMADVYNMMNREKLAKELDHTMLRWTEKGNGKAAKPG